ncbi:Uncharacterized protein PECH_002446 [Penicillium ucsense]|uniref:amidase n=1 Tax=Penicillium ucsense TaxID=2839758 RepID=A0A8J8W5J2_9EURO|nr:Uncharacterized protein PECM_003075 [Penicillium ucsense]KAF7737981.1 Uncharacterized protein PECH_002446 [Penicillium ucsense]
MSLNNWEQQAQKGRDILQNSIPKQWLLPESRLPPTTQKNVIRFIRESGALSEHELRITDSSATELVREMRRGKLAAEEVIVAFLKRAVVGHQLLNFATELLADEAIARARELDRFYKTTGRLIGPLHGVPVSVKEHVGMKKKTCNTGFVSWIDNIATEDAHLLRLLKNAGAIFHVRTNQPQSLMHLCCSNNITGTTLNPHNRTLTPGGSSGGEGASIGFKCSPLGVGTDIGGSIRCPAAFCGGYGFRPTAMRNPMAGIQVACIGQETIHGVVGPMASTSVDDLELFQRAVLDQEPWEEETSLMPVPWRNVIPSRDITIGIMWDDGIVRPHPPITRALRMAKEKLVRAGIKIVDWKPYDHERGWKIISALYFPDGGALTRKTLAESGEPARPLTEWALSYSRPTPLTHPEAWTLQHERDTYRDEYQAALKRHQVDFVLGPAYPAAAAVMGESQYWNYTAIWNMTDMPAVTFPSGLAVDPGLDALTEQDKKYIPRNEIDKREWEKYQSPARYENAPIALQLAGRHFKDEETLATAKLVDEIIKDGVRGLKL